MRLLAGRWGKKDTNIDTNATKMYEKSTHPKSFGRRQLTRADHLCYLQTFMREIKWFSSSLFPAWAGLRPTVCLATWKAVVSRYLMLTVRCLDSNEWRLAQGKGPFIRRVRVRRVLLPKECQIHEFHHFGDIFKRKNFKWACTFSKWPLVTHTHLRDETVETRKHHS